MNKEIDDSDNHHVAWADRIGLNKQWARDIQFCSDCFGTSMYSIAVRRFHNNIPNIKDGPDLHEIIAKYRDTTLTAEHDRLLDEWKSKYPDYAMNPDYVSQKSEEIGDFISSKLYHYILQTLEDYGFGFYASDVDEDVLK